MHPKIEDVRLLPRSVPTFCQAGNCTTNAEWWLVSEGRAITSYCQHHATVTLEEYRRHNMLEDWHTEPIYHEGKKSVTMGRHV